MLQIQTIQTTEIKLTPYITAYLAALMKFVDELEVDGITVNTFVPLFKGIATMGRKAEKNQRLNQFLQNNVQSHLDEIVKSFGFPMTFGDVEHHELNTYFNEACGILKLIPFELFFVNTGRTQFRGNRIKQTVRGNNNITIGSVNGGTIIGGNGNVVGQVNQHFGNSINIRTNGGDFCGNDIHIGDNY